MDSAEEKTVFIPDDKHFAFPDNIVVSEYKDYIFVVSVDTANWLILNSKDQLDLFNLLKYKSVGEALGLYKGSFESAESLLSQIIARDFECRDVKLKSQESSLHLYLTNACNLRCPHCYMSAGIKKQDELSNDELKNIIKEAAHHGVNHITFSGGEIMMCKELKDYVNLAFEYGIKVELLTNGTLMTDEFVNQIEGKVTRVQISIDGYDETSNALVRGNGNFERAMRSVDILVDHSMNVDIGITPRFHKSLHEEINLYVEFVHSIQKRYDNRVIIAFTSALFDGRELKLSDEDRQYYSNCISKITDQCFGMMNKDLGFVKFHKEHGIDENCAYGNLTISSVGDIFFCSQISPMKPFGNIRDLNLRDAFEMSKKAKEQSNINNLEPCGQCELKYICGGDCRIKYFEQMLDCKNTETPRRVCTNTIKSNVYEQMLRTHEYLFD